MSKGLEALEELRKETRKGGTSYIVKSEKRRLHNIIEKELKALEIIKRKNVDVLILRINYTQSVEKYNQHKYETCKNLTQEEHDLLKEVLL